MAFAGINYLAVLAAAIAGFMFGAGWYGAQVLQPVWSWCLESGRCFSAGTVPSHSRPRIYRGPWYPTRATANRFPHGFPSLTLVGSQIHRSSC